MKVLPSYHRLNSDEAPRSTRTQEFGAEGRMGEDESLAHDMLMSSTPGSPSWGIRNPIGSVLLDGVENIGVGTSQSLLPLYDIGGSPEPAHSHPIDIFGSNLNSPSQTVNYVKGQEITTKEAARLALKCPILRQTVSQTMIVSEYLHKRLDSLGILATQSRRLPARLDHADEHETPSWMGRAAGLRYPKVRQPLLKCGVLRERIAPLGIAPGSSRRLVSQTDHPLLCDTPFRLQDSQEHAASNYSGSRQASENSQVLKETQTRVASCSTRSRQLPSGDGHPLDCDSAAIEDANVLDLEHKVFSTFNLCQPIPCSDVQSSDTVNVDATTTSLGVVESVVKPEDVTESLPLTSTLGSHTKVPPLGEGDGPGLDEYFQTFKTLKKHDRVKLREFLDSLNRVEDSPTVVDVASTLASNSAPKSGNRLNPKAREFCRSDGNCSDSNISDHGHQGWLPWPHDPGPQSNMPVIWHRIAKPMNVLTQSVHPTFQKPLPFRTPIPIVSPSTMTDNGYGREATVETVPLDVGKYYLEDFRLSYPLTGRLKAAPPAESKKRLATTIQQRLEYILMQQRERKGAMKTFQEEDKENMGPTLRTKRSETWALG